MGVERTTVRLLNDSFVANTVHDFVIVIHITNVPFNLFVSNENVQLWGFAGFVEVEPRTCVHVWKRKIGSVEA